MPPHRLDYLRVSLLPKIGPARGKALLQRFSTFENILKADARELASTDGFQRTMAAQIKEAASNRALVDSIERTVEQNAQLCEKEGVSFVSIADEAYPAPLRRIYDPPLYLFIKGVLPAEERQCVAIVGTRSPTEYGRRAAEHFASKLTRNGISVVSGMALGIDTIAHQIAIREGGSTVAVLGCGINVVYPPSNKRLAAAIPEHGALVSEYLFNAKPDAPNFPRRNRIISALSCATIVVETAVKGGAMITARLAQDQDKDVFAVPGSIFSPKSEGTNLLIKANLAQPLTRIEDLYENVGALQTNRKNIPRPAIQLTIVEEAIVNQLSNDPVHIDALAQTTGASTTDLLIQLLQLELKGVVRQLPGKFFQRS